MDQKEQQPVPRFTFTNFGEGIKSGFKNYVNFKGTTSKLEYWYWLLFLLPIYFGAAALDTFLRSESYGMFAYAGTLSFYALVIPTFAIVARRVRETGWSEFVILVVAGFSVLVPISLLVVAFLPKKKQVKYYQEEEEEAPAEVFQRTDTSLPVNVVDSEGIPVRREPKKGVLLTVTIMVLSLGFSWLMVGLIFLYSIAGAMFSPVPAPIQDYVIFLISTVLGSHVMAAMLSWFLIESKAAIRVAIISAVVSSGFIALLYFAF